MSSVNGLKKSSSYNQSSILNFFNENDNSNYIVIIKALHEKLFSIQKYLDFIIKTKKTSEDELKQRICVLENQVEKGRREKESTIPENSTKVFENELQTKICILEKEIEQEKREKVFSFKKTTVKFKFMAALAIAIRKYLLPPELETIMNENSILKKTIKDIEEKEIDKANASTEITISLNKRLEELEESIKNMREKNESEKEADDLLRRELWDQITSLERDLDYEVANKNKILADYEALKNEFISKKINC